MKTYEEVYEECKEAEYSNLKHQFGWEDKLYTEEEIREKLIDMYRLMCNKHGKADIWNMNADELLENVDIFIQEELFGDKE